MGGFIGVDMKKKLPILLLIVVIFLAPNLATVARAEVQQPAIINSLSDRVANAVITEVSKQTGISPKNLKITQSSPQTWSNGCLGLSKPGEICTQALVEGWRVVVAGNKQTWVYRSNRNGQILRLESPKKSTSITN